MIVQNHEYICHSLIGIQKQDNEDNYLVIENEQYDIFAIFDGVGSALNSKEATKIAKAFITTNYKRFLVSHICLDKLMYECNNHILSIGMPELLTTYCIIIVPKNSHQKAIYSYMGDSRIYLITRQFIEQITTDDKLQLTNTVTKCLGMNTLERHDFRHNSINTVDKNLLLCTDGFYHFLEKDRMLFFEIFNKKSMHSIQKELMSIIIDRNKDDATFLLIR